MERDSYFCAWISGGFLAAVTLAALASPCRGADLLAKFRQDYPRASEKLQESYSHVTVQTTERRTDRQGRFMWSENCTYLRNGLAFRKVATVTESGNARSGPAVGYIAASGGTPAKFFSMGKDPGQEQYSLTRFGAIDQSDFLALAQVSCRPLFAAYCGDVTVIRKFIAFPYVHLVSARERLLDGKRVVEILVNETPTQGAHSQLRLYFQPDTWAFAGWTQPVLGPHDKMTDPHSNIELRIGYVNGNSFELASIDRWEASTLSPDRRTDELRISVNSIQFGSLPADQFTMGALGMDEPGSTRVGTSFHYFLLANALVLIALAVCFSVLASKRRRRRALVSADGSAA